MRIAFYTTTMLEHGGGLEKYLIETAKNLSEFPDAQVDVITMDNKFTERVANILGFYYFKKIDKALLYKENLDAITERLGNSRYYKRASFKQLSEKLNEYDVIYSKNELLEAFILKFFVGYRNLPPIIFGCHTPVFYPETTSLQSKLHNFLYNGFVYKWLANGVRSFHVANDFDKRLLSGIFPKRNVFMIHNPFNFTQFNENLEKNTYDFQFDASKCNILWIARLTEQKGVSALVNIVEKINTKNGKDKVVFNIVGNGQMDADVAKLAEKWDNVNWLGYVEYRYLPSIYNRNDLFISTSKWESLPFNILEAQSIGLPAIAFDIPGPQDIIRDGSTGFLVKNEDEFCERIFEISDSGKKFDTDEITLSIRKSFDPKDIYAQLFSMLQSVLEK
jgi:glycosyltransferase involved in cell wall biosynthesis